MEIMGLCPKGRGGGLAVSFRKFHARDTIAKAGIASRLAQTGSGSPMSYDAVMDLQSRPGGATGAEAPRGEMIAQSLARGRDFLDVDEAGLQHVLGVAIFEASLFGAARADHREHIHPRGSFVGE
jgi:hypothetical protein